MAAHLKEAWYYGRCVRVSRAGIALAPGDSVILSHLITAEELASYTAGEFSVGVVETTPNGLLRLHVGVVTLPTP